MPDLSLFDPRRAARLWLTDANLRPRRKAPPKAVGYFKGVFPEARKSKPTDDIEVE